MKTKMFLFYDLDGSVHNLGCPANVPRYCTRNPGENPQYYYAEELHRGDYRWHVYREME